MNILSICLFINAPAFVCRSDSVGLVMGKEKSFTVEGINASSINAVSMFQSRANSHPASRSAFCLLYLEKGLDRIR